MHKTQKEKIILSKIDKARKHMIDMAKDNPLNSAEVINASTKLDKLLNIYTKYQVNKKGKTVLSIDKKLWRNRDFQSAL